MHPQRPSRTLVLAFDGTSNEFDDTNTNIVTLCALLEVENRDRQMVYYQPGIGTYAPPGVAGTIKQAVVKTADLLVAWYLNQHVMDGYSFLMNNHMPGDKICIFGFSRGAYTARALAGMLHWVGLLPQGNHEQVPFAYRLYATGSHRGLKFKETFCKIVEIEMLGVWDTVASVGLLLPKTLPFVSNDTVKTFRHAVSLDEHRKRFDVTLWSPHEEVTGGLSALQDASVKEVWFAGCHCDVGGGHVKDGTSPNLANISLRWMLSEIKNHSSILFNDERLDKYAIPKDCVPRAPYRKNVHTVSRLGNDEIKSTRIGSIEIAPPGVNIPKWDEADEMDCAAEAHDMLRLNPLWWCVQFMIWRGKSRVFPKDRRSLKHNHIHYSVKRRIEKRSGYSPKTCDLPPNWVDNCHPNQPNSP
ncbi:hypothetical protein CPB86DRAFT_857094 [Serendipita vermifera]|nr:hypothetical protein CPB86DRAFT_857094 [Serendipita vermifera]